MTEAEARRRLQPFFDAWREKRGQEMAGPGFVSEDWYAKYGEKANYVLITDADLVNHLRQTWKHKDDRNNNPTVENVICVVMSFC